MDEDLQKEIEMLKQRVQDLETANNVAFIESVDERLISNTAAVTSANILQTYSNSVTGTVDSLAIPDGWMLRHWKGVARLVPFYNLSKK